MSEALHTVTITGTPDEPAIEFRCHGDRESDCHRFPDCDCETWWPGDDDDHDASGHPRVVHDHCWRRPLFAYGAYYPDAEDAIADGHPIGKTGPVRTSWDGEVIEWEFVAVETQQKEEN